MGQIRNTIKRVLIESITFGEPKVVNLVMSEDEKYILGSYGMCGWNSINDPICGPLRHHIKEVVDGKVNGTIPTVNRDVRELEQELFEWNFMATDEGYQWVSLGMERGEEINNCMRRCYRNIIDKYKPKVVTFETYTMAVKPDENIFDQI